MKQIIIGTAGHVDHGKTTLIRALTGIQTDRLREEQERGMSIELGFAHFDLPGGARAGIVDVPGHQRFIKNMLMGATGMDMVVLVIAADEGVMPQTREHFEILRLLDVKTGVIALTKADLVDEEWLELVQDDIRDLVRRSFMADAPIIPVSSVSGQGIPDLVAAMDAIAAQTEERTAIGPFRMSIDRVFTMAGFGTVVTGTLRSGIVRTGEPAQILPQGLQTRVRQLQVHGEKVESARAGSRVAMNLAGLEVSDAARGDVVAAAGSLTPTSMVDVRLDLLASLESPLAHRSRVRFHTGAVEIMGRITLLDREQAKPGESVLAQIRLEAPTAVGRHDRFVLRRYSPGVLLGGGMILDPHPARHRRNQAGIVESLLVRERGTAEDVVAQALLHAGPRALAVEELTASTGLPRAEVTDTLSVLLESEGRSPVVAIGTRWVHADQLHALEQRLLDLLAEHHARAPLSPGISREELRARAGRGLDTRVFNLALERLENAGSIRQEGSLVWRAEHQVRLSAEQDRVAQSILETFRAAALNPPTVEEALSRAGARSNGRDVFEVLVHRGELVKIAEGLYLERETLRTTVETAVELIRSQGSVTVSQLRDAIHSSRKITVPLMEYLDATRVTRRRGDERVLY